MPSRQWPPSNLRAAPGLDPRREPRKSYTLGVRVHAGARNRWAARVLPPRVAATMSSMTPQIVVVHVLIAALPFFLANWLGSHSVSSGYHLITLFEDVDEAPAFNVVFRVATPLVYLILVAAGAYTLGLDDWTTNLYLVVVYYFALRWLFNLVIGRGQLLNWPSQLSIALVTVTIAYQLHVRLLAKRASLLPDVAGLGNELWILVIVYVYTVLNRLPASQRGSARRRASYIRHRFRVLCRQFSRDISPLTRDSTEEALVYAVMIYETFNRPWIYRAIERHLLAPAGLAKSFGIMQVQTEGDAILDDRATVKVGAEKLLAAYREALPNAEREVAKWGGGTDEHSSHAKLLAARLAAQQYNIRGSYSDEIQSIFDLMLEEFYTSARRIPSAGSE